MNTLWPASWLWWRRKVGLIGPLCGDSELRESGNEDKAWVAGFEQEWHESPGTDVGACNVDVVCFVEALAERNLAFEELDV